MDVVSYRSVRLEHPEWPSDGQLRHHVRAALTSVLGMDMSTIDVAVRDGVVHLDGEATHAAADEDVRKAVSGIHGVVGVIDRTASRVACPHDAALQH